MTGMAHHWLTYGGMAAGGAAGGIMGAPGIAAKPGGGGGGYPCDGLYMGTPPGGGGGGCMPAGIPIGFSDIQPMQMFSRGRVPKRNRIAAISSRGHFLAVGRHGHRARAVNHAGKGRRLLSGARVPKADAVAMIAH